MLKKVVFPVAVLIMLLFAGNSAATPPAGKQVGLPREKNLSPLGAPSNLRYKIRYTDYRSGIVELKWHDNSSAEDEFVLTEAVPGYDCRSWSNHDAAHFPANTASGKWNVPDPTGTYYGGIGLLNAHSILLGFKCPQDYMLVARNGAGSSDPSNIIVLDADTPNAPTNVSFDGDMVRWQYKPKGYPLDATGWLCFSFEGFGNVCSGMNCDWCQGVYTQSDGWYSFPLSVNCTRLSTALRTDPSPYAVIIPASKPTEEVCR